ncbi:MAG: class I SAM-dependent methyltransferase [Spirochaetales bacterium]|nr:class I SAM-dependent methyltransferase [Spirochaetales bacterium]
MINILKLKHFNKAASEGNPDKILQTLEIKPGLSIGDIGSGGGYYTLQLAELVGESGTVYAVDVNKGNLEYVEKEVKKKNLQDRVNFILATDENSNLPDESIDLLFLRNSFHHLKNRKDYFINLKKCLKEEGKIVIIDHKKGHRSGPAMNHGTGEGEIELNLEAAGFREHSSFSFLPGQWFFIYKK